MSLERDAQRWIEEQRQILIARIEQDKKDNTAKKGTYLGKNEDGSSRVRVDGVEKRVNVTGDNYLRKGDGVMVDEINTGEVKRRKRREVAIAGNRQQRKKPGKKRLILPDLELSNRYDYFLIELSWDTGRDLDITVEITNPKAINPSTNIFTWVNHGLEPGDIVKISKIRDSDTLPSGLEPRDYYAVIYDNNSFAVSLAGPDGPVVDITTEGIGGFGARNKRTDSYALITPWIRGYSWYGQTTFDFMQWGGDVVGESGTEAILIDVDRFSLYYPDTTAIEIDLRAHWYSEVGNGPVRVLFTGFRGGEMEKTDATWINPTALDAEILGNPFEQVISDLTQEVRPRGERIALVTLDIDTGIV